MVERALEHAQARGIAVAIYRPGFVTGHSKTGIELDPASQLFAAFDLSDAAMATSGNYRQFFEAEGKKMFSGS